MSFIFNTLIALYTAQRCTSPVQRKEIRDLSSQELNTFLTTFRALNNKASRNGQSIYDQYTRIHNENVNFAHGVPAFLPWHRQFIRNIEKELQKINPRVVLPFWDWTKDSQDPHLSPLFNQLGFGGNGNRNQGMCVTDGTFAYFNVRYPQPHCLRRDFDLGNAISPFASPEIILRLLYKQGSFESFYKELEIHHGSVHVNIGGNRGDMFPMTSPNDPLFYLHHTFIDMIWWNWQRIRNFRNEYNGLDKNTGRNVNINIIMGPFNTRVSDVMDTRAQGLCYTYPLYDPVNNNRGNIQRRALVNDLASRTTKRIDIDSVLSSPLSGRGSGIPTSTLDDSSNVPKNLQLLSKIIHSDVSKNMTENMPAYGGKGLKPIKHLPDNYLRMIKASKQYSRSVHDKVNGIYSYLNSQGYKPLV